MDGTQLARIAELLLMVATTLAFVWVGVPEAWPWRVVGESLGRTVRSGRRVLYLLACCSILLANYLYLHLRIDQGLTSWVVAQRGEDFTSAVHGIEGEAVASVQGALHWPPLTWFLAYTYVVVFPCLVFVSLFVFDRLRHRRGLAMVLLGYVFNYLIVLPFYLLFPVRETFHYYREDLHSSGVRLLLDEIHPVVMQAYRAMSGLDNCFPSFHTSLAATMALVAWHSGRARFAWLISFFAAANILSTVYLGIHWVTDVAAGLLVGVLAYALAGLLSARWAGSRPARPAS